MTSQSNHDIRLLQDFVDRSAQEWPAEAALVSGEERLSYADLDRLSDRIAAHLVDAGCEAGDRIALLMAKAPIAIVAMQAILKAGCVYLPLDADSPAARLARIVDSAEPRLFLASPEVTPLLDRLAALTALPPVWSVAAAPVAGERVRSERQRGDWDVEATPARPAIGPDSPAYVLYTSGSTGQPKGVVISHRNVISFSTWFVRTFEARAGERVSGHPALHFDLSTLDVYTALAVGAELHMVPSGLGLNARALAGWIRDSELNRWVSVPSVLTYMAKFDLPAEEDFPALERVLWCGEVLPTPVLAHWMRRLPRVRFTNLYGPTEATVASSWYDLEEIPGDETEPIPIGRACDGEELLVLDDDGRPLGPGEVGDLYIGGVGLSSGYWRDVEKTAAAFVSDRRPGREGKIYKTGDLASVDEAGLFHYLGRADSQIKSRGYRIELGEIEAALGTVAGVRECAVVGVEAEDFGGVAICAAYVGPVEPPQLRKALGAELPSYMLPVRWLGMDVLPRNQNGKIDRSRLREEFSEGRDRDRGRV